MNKLTKSLPLSLSSSGGGRQSMKEINDESLYVR